MTPLADAARLDAVRASGLLGCADVEHEPFDRLVGMACDRLRMPIAALSVLTADLQTVVAARGTERMAFDARESLCQHVVEADDLFVVHDVRSDERYGPDSLPARAGVVSYAGVPLRDAAGHVLGALCAVDTQPRTWTPQEIRLLEGLSEIGTAEILLRTTAAAADRADRRMSAVVASALDAIVTTDSAGFVTEFNPAAERMFARTREEALGRRLGDLIVPPALRTAHEEGLARNASTGIGRVLDQRLELSGMRADGSEFPVELTVTRSDDDGETTYTGFLRDITEQRRAERALRDTEAQLALAVETAPVVLFAFDREGILTLCEGSALKAWGVTPGEAVGHSALEYYAGNDEALHAIGRTLAGESVDLTHQSGPVVVETRYRPIWEGEEVVGVAGVALDVTERLRDEARIAELAYLDRLTRLPNRVWLEEQVDDLLGPQAWAAGRTAALLFVDLDDFQTVNDSLGHAAGDDVLREAAARLLAVAGSDGLLARQGADEFLLFVNDLGTDPRPAAERFALEAIAALQSPFAVAGLEFHVEASVGISLFPRHGDGFSELLRGAESALHRAKRAGETCMAVHRRDDEGARRRLTMSARLRRALTEEQFVLHYQPIFDLGAGRVSALEALLRWDDPDHGLIPPLDFIGLAETTGLIIEIGAWVAEAACRRQRAWQALGLDISVGFNVSPVQVQRGDFPDRLARVLERTGADPGRMVVEITESTALDENGVNPELARLAALGTQVVIDDFGAGHSSLTRLRGLDVDGLKLDRALLMGVDEDPGACAVVTATLALCEALDIRSVAEGVETDAQKEFLLTGGCDLAQGFGLARPMPAEQATAFLQSPEAGLRALTGA